MALVNSTDIAFEFPVYLIANHGERWTCRTPDDLTRVVRPTQRAVDMPTCNSLVLQAGMRGDAAPP